MAQTTTLTLAEFLTARLDEDEAAARAAGGVDGYHDFFFDDPDDPQDPHIARHDPARVLREVEAKRAILAEHVSLYPQPKDAPGSRPVRYLAAVYADHPDYREEWRG